MTPLLLLTLTAHADEGSVPVPTSHALLQGWATLMDQDLNDVADAAGYGDPEDDPGFKIRRVRLGLEGESDVVRYGVTVGVSSPYDSVEAAQGGSESVQLVDAYGAWAPIDDLWVIGGQQKVPASREQLIASGDLVFTDRSVSSHWISPGRDLGMVVDYALSPVRVRVGAFNGGGDLFGDSDPGKLYAARAEVNLGEGNTYQTWGVVDGYALGVGVDGYMNSTRAIEGKGLGADLMFRMQGLALLAEARLSQVAPNETLAVVPGVLSETNGRGALVQLGYTIGSLEPAVRYSLMDNDTDTEDAGDVSQVTAGVTYHRANDRIRAGLGYVLRMEDGGGVIPNDSVRMWFQLRL